MSTVAGVCPKQGHGFWLGESCPKCTSSPVPEALTNINTEEWIRGEWEHIDPNNPRLYIRDKQHLRMECEKHGVMPKCLTRAKSQGKGVEVRW